MFFDTNVIINVLDIQENNKEVYLLVDKYIKNKNAYISAIVYSEVLAYPKLELEEKNNIKLYFTNNFKLVSVNKKIAGLAAEISISKRLETGKKLKLTDAIIAATAILRGKPLLTFDKEDFKNISNLELV